MNTSLNGFSTAHDMLGALRRREISAVELLALHRKRIARHNATVNAIIIPNQEGAEQAAREADAARARGEDRPLLGLPMTVKDWIEVAGLRSTAGDANLKDYRAQCDAPIVARARTAGVVLIGKTNMAPWGGDWQTANPVFGRSVNPWDAERTPGGSTGGGAAAVAAGLTPLEWGNDIGGSVRIPPAFCGVYGHRPSETLLPRTGQTPDFTGRHLPNPATGLAVVGPLARCAEDLELALDVTAGPDQGEDVAWRVTLPPARRTRLHEFRVAVMPPLPWLPVDEDILAAQERLAAGLARLGARVAVVQPEGFDDLREFHKLYSKLLITMMTMQLSREQRAEVAKWGHEEAARRGDEFMESNAGAFEATAPDYVRWFGQREGYRAALRAFFREWDVLLSPVTMTLAFRHDEAPVEMDADDRTLTINGQTVPYGQLGVYPGLATLPGHPATAFPVGLSRSGLPVALQAVGPYLEDRTSLRFAALVAQEFGGFTPPPGFED